MHHRHSLKYIACGRQVIDEGTTSGHRWRRQYLERGERAGGRFCSLFDFTDDRFIKRMYIYLDPAYASRDADRLYWRRAEPRW
jgi:hypothetical protein